MYLTLLFQDINYQNLLKIQLENFTTYKDIFDSNIYISKYQDKPLLKNQLKGHIQQVKVEENKKQNYDTVSVNNIYS